MLTFLAANNKFTYMLTIRKHGYSQPRQIICMHLAFARVLENQNILSSQVKRKMKSHQ